MISTSRTEVDHAVDHFNIQVGAFTLSVKILSLRVFLFLFLLCLLITRKLQSSKPLEIHVYAVYATFNNNNNSNNNNKIIIIIMETNTENRN